MSDYHSVSDRGQVRDDNEDARDEREICDGILLVVADGMGGHECGEVASRVAVEAIVQIVKNSPAPDLRERLHNGFLVANQRILTEAERWGVQGMGTTAVAAFVREEEVFVAHVGDSRLYHIRGGRVIAKTTDHTRVQKMVEKGILTAAEARRHPDANVVTRALGQARLADGSALLPEVLQEPLRLAPGDSIVLCTDGLYDEVEDPEIAEVVAHNTTAKAAAEALLKLANKRGGHDNITVTVLLYGTDMGLSPPGRLKERITEEEVQEEVPPTPIRHGGQWAAVGVTAMGAAILGICVAEWGWHRSLVPIRRAPDASVSDGTMRWGRDARDAGPTADMNCSSGPHEDGAKAVDSGQKKPQKETANKPQKGGDLHNGAAKKPKESKESIPKPKASERTNPKGGDQRNVAPKKSKEADPKPSNTKSPMPGPFKEPNKKQGEGQPKEPPNKPQEPNKKQGEGQSREPAPTESRGGA